MCRLTILKSELISVEKWEAVCVPFGQNLKEQKKKSVTGEQNMKIMRKIRRNWLKKCFQRLKKIMPEKRKEQEN